jgi:hypothetical protein
VSDLDDAFASVGLDEHQPALANCAQMRTARDEAYLVSRQCKTGTDETADCTRPDHTDPHELMPCKKANDYDFILSYALQQSRLVL